MKLFKVLLLLIVLFSFSTGFDLNCIFGDNADSQYFCVNLNLILHHNGQISSVSGVKRHGTTLSDVRLLYMTSDNTRYIPRNVLNHFPNLEKVHFNCKPKKNLTTADDKLCLNQDSLYVGAFSGWSRVFSLTLQGHNFNKLIANTFKGLENAMLLFLPDNEIRSISSQTFNGLNRLNFLQLSGNNIKEIEPGTFDTLINLENLSLYGNALKSLPRDMFRNNKKLRKIGLLNNHLEVIDKQVIDTNQGIDLIRVKNNICVDKNFQSVKGSSMLTMFKSSILTCTAENAQFNDLVFHHRKLLAELKRLKDKIDGERKACKTPQARELIQTILDLQRDLEELRNYRLKYLQLLGKSQKIDSSARRRFSRPSDKQPAVKNNLMEVLKRNKKMMKVNANLVKSIKSIVNFMEHIRYADCKIRQL